MTTKKGSAASGKTPFDAIREAEEIAHAKIEAEEAKLRKETEDAQSRNVRYLEDKRAEITDNAKAELKESKAGMTEILAKAEREAGSEAARLAQKAKENKPKIMQMLTDRFLSLR